MIFNPIDKLTFGGNAQYLDNLTGELYQAVVTAGGIPTGNIPAESSHALDLTAFASYLAPALHTTLNVNDQDQRQTFAGSSFDSNSLTGSATYSNLLFRGMFNATLGVVRSSISST